MYFQDDFGYFTIVIRIIILVLVCAGAQRLHDCIALVTMQVMHVVLNVTCTSMSI
jgi:hypothetical protein